MEQRKIRVYKIEDTYLIKNDNYDDLNIIIDGKNVCLKSKEKIQLNKPTKIILPIKKCRTNNYIDENNNVLSVEDYKLKHTELLEKYKDDNWNSLEDEFKFKKFISIWKEKIVEYIEKQELEIELIELSNTDNKYLTPIRMLSDKLEPLFECNYSIESLFREIANELGFKETIKNTCCENTKDLKYSFHANNSLEYLTINGTYIKEEFYKLNLKCIGTEKECIDKIDNIKIKIKNYLVGIKNTELNNTFNRKNVLEKISRIKCTSDKLKVNKSSYIDLQTLKLQLNTLIEELKSLNE